MKTISFPDGETVPALGQGTWYMGDEANRRAQEIATLRLGIDLGLTVIDTAEMYGSGRSERLVGEAIEGRREEVFLVSKVLPNHADFKGTIAACEASLKRLNTDRIDLYLLHWNGGKPFAPAIEAFERLKRDGKIRKWGVSNLDLAEMEEIVAAPDGGKVATNQLLYNLQSRGIEWDLVPWSAERALPIMAYSPIGQAYLLSEPSLIALAGDLGLTPAQLALAFVLQTPNVQAIPKAGQRRHVEENAGAADVTLSPETLAELDRMFPPPSGPTPARDDLEPHVSDAADGLEPHLRVDLVLAHHHGLRAEPLDDGADMRANMGRGDEHRQVPHLRGAFIGALNADRLELLEFRWRHGEVAFVAVAMHGLGEIALPVVGQRQDGQTCLPARDWRRRAGAPDANVHARPSSAASGRYRRLRRCLRGWSAGRGWRRAR